LHISQADHLDAILEPLGKRVRGFYGSQGGSSLTKDTAVAVCTIEKANSLVNKLLEEGRLSELAILVIDELHMVCDYASSSTIIVCALQSFLLTKGFSSCTASKLLLNFMSRLGTETVAIYLSFSSPNFAMQPVVENVTMERVVRRTGPQVQADVLTCKLWA